MNREMMTPEFAKFLVENGYTDVRNIGGGRWAGLLKFLFTHAIIVGQNNDWGNYEQRWCYHDKASALAAFEAVKDWNNSEPEGWHRHLPSGRRQGPEHELQAALKEDAS